MEFPLKYKALNKNIFGRSIYKLVPIRYQDRLDIMKWRNEQMYHLRQQKPLTEKVQNNYFKNTLLPLFDIEKPEQILFSYLYKDKCIGYGGLVHINWIDKNAEISFIMDTKLEKKEFDLHWSNYLKLLNQTAFEELKMHKIFTYAYDIRPQLYNVLEKNHFKKEAVLKKHCFFNGNFVDVIIHSKIKD